LVLLFFVLLVAWVGLWWYAEGRMQAGITHWVSTASANPNVKFTYASLARGNSPLAATVTVTDLQATVQTGTGAASVVVTLPSLRLRIAAANPTVVHVDYPPQINISAPRGDAAVTFGSIDVAESLDPAALFNSTIQPFRGAQANASNINILASNGSLQVLHIDSIAVQGTINRNAGPGDTALAFSESFNGISLSSLLTRLAQVPFNGQIGQFAITFSGSGPLPQNWQDIASQVNAFPADDKADRAKVIFTALHAWAAAGGSGTMGVTLVLGPSTMNADASVKFDANVQPAGTADVTANHLDAFTAAIVAAYPQVQNSVNQIEAQLSPYLSTTNDGGQILTVHVTYGKGAVNVNGQKVSNMPPMDWNMLYTGQ
jgi:hypothetical protein